MRELHRAELRDSWAAWLGVSLAFVMTNLCLALAAAIEVIGINAVRSGLINFWESSAYTFVPAGNVFYCAIVGAVVIGSSTGLVIDSRRGSLARLALAGATPVQVRRTLMSQLVVVTLAAAVVADLLALALLRPTVSYIAAGVGDDVAAPPVSFAVWPMLIANAIAVLAALVGGGRAARKASDIPPVEALRQSSAAAERGMTGARWVGFVLCAIVIAGICAIVPFLSRFSEKEVFSNIFLSALTLVVIGAAAISCLAPVVTGPLTRAWTALVPTKDAVWHLTRATAMAKSARLTKSVMPVMVTIALLSGMVLVGNVAMSVVGRFLPPGEDAGLSSHDVISFLGLPLAVSLSGSVGSLILMSRQRDAELALSGIVGATPAQRLTLPVLEGVVITVTGALLALVPLGLTLGYLAAALPLAGFPFAFEPSWGVFIGGFVACLLVSVAATVLPTLPAHRLPEPRVIARLVAE